MNEWMDGWMDGDGDVLWISSQKNKVKNQTRDYKMWCVLHATGNLVHDDYAHTLTFPNEEKYPENIWRTNTNTHFPKNKENGKQRRGVGYCCLLIVIRMKRVSESPRNHLFSFVFLQMKVIFF